MNTPNHQTQSKGFTVIEILVVIALLTVGCVLFFTQKAHLDSMDRDMKRKTAINAMYYNLEEVFYEKNQYYPGKINNTVLKAMDPNLFSDPNGKKLGESDSNYRYIAENCVDDKCKKYTLRSKLENEADYVKESRHKD